MKLKKVQRIDFLRAGQSFVTYGKLMMTFAALASLLLLWYTGVFFQIHLMQREITSEQGRIARLNQQKEEELASAERTVVAAPLVEGVKEELQLRFRSVPPWSEVLRALGEAMSRNVQLTEVKIGGSSGDGNYQLHFVGEGMKTGHIRDLITRLEDSLWFQGVRLNDLKRSGEGNRQYQFVVDVSVEWGERKGNVRRPL